MDTTGLDAQAASEQWAAFSRQLSDAAIARIEAGGYASGLREGKQFVATFGRAEGVEVEGL